MSDTPITKSYEALAGNYSKTSKMERSSSTNEGEGQADEPNLIKQLVDSVAKGLNGASTGKTLSHVLTDKIAKIGAYEPVVAVFGKSGVGKSSLCNALFGKDLANISHVGACTRIPQPILVNILGQRIKLIDFPGAGESPERDVEYKKLYESWLSQIDLILWVIKVDDRAFTSDLAFFNDVILTSGFPIERFLLIINQADKAEPVREWNEKRGTPGPHQLQNILAKKEYVAEVFQIPESRVVAVSANEKYRLTHLSEELILAMPPEGKLGFFRALLPENRTEEGKEEVKRGLIASIMTFLKENGPNIVHYAAPFVKDFVVKLLPRLLKRG